MQRLCWLAALAPCLFGCVTPLQQNVCETSGPGNGPPAYLRQCHMSDDQLHMLLFAPQPTGHPNFGAAGR